MMDGRCISKQKRYGRYHTFIQKGERIVINTVYHTVQEQEIIVQKTTDYSRFRFDARNRTPDPEYVDRLAAAIEKKNLLHLFPIVVARDMTIIDGQHRTMAAQKLGVPVYWIASEEMTVLDAGELEFKHWENKDFLAFYCAQRKADYVTLREFWKKYDFLTLMTAAKLCNYESATKNTANFRRGLYKANDVSFGVKVAEALLDFKRWGKPFYRQSEFVYAISNLMGNVHYDHSIMMARMEGASTKLVKCADTESYIALINEIYNFRARSNRAELRKLMSNDADFRPDMKKKKENNSNGNGKM